MRKQQEPFQPFLINEFLDSQPFTGDVSLKQDFMDIGNHLQAILQTPDGQQVAQKIGACAIKIKNTGQFTVAIRYCFNYAKQVCQDNLVIAGLVFLLLFSVMIDFVFNNGSFTKMTIKDMIMPILNQLTKYGIPGIMMFMQTSK